MQADDPPGAARKAGEPTPQMLGSASADGSQADHGRTSVADDGSTAQVWPLLVSAPPLASGACASLLTLWSKLRAGRLCPLWAELDVTQLKPWMGRLLIVDYPEPSAASGYYALFGTGLTERFRADVTGRRTDDVTFGPATGIVHHWACARARRLAKPVVTLAVVHYRVGGEARYEQLLLPFTYRSAALADRLLGLIEFLPPDKDQATRLEHVLYFGLLSERVIDIWCG